MSEERLALLEEIPLLDIDELVEELAQELVGRHIIPERAARDALHIAVAAVQKMDYLLTWNCAHLANANKLGHIRRVNALLGLPVPQLVTPLEMIGEDNES